MGDMFMRNIYKNYEMSQIERNIIIGSLLGYGSLALYGRSTNALYREHGCDAQIPYRKWKAEMLKSLDFKLQMNCKYAKLCSPSHPIYTELYEMFYKDGIKIITNENVKLLDHTIGLACLFMDDGSLIIDSSKRKHSIYIFPRVSLCTLSFTKEENEILINHLKETFNIDFKLKKRKDGKNYILEINKRKELYKFINLIQKYVNMIPEMKYKVSINENLIKKKNNLLMEGYKAISIGAFDIVQNGYTKEEEELIINMKNNNCSYKEIGKTLNRSYYGITDKIRRLKKKPELSP